MGIKNEPGFLTLKMKKKNTKKGAPPLDQGGIYHVVIFNKIHAFMMWSEVTPPSPVICTPWCKKKEYAVSTLYYGQGVLYTCTTNVKSQSTKTAVQEVQKIPGEVH